MTTQEFTERWIRVYEGTYDFTRPYCWEELSFTAYGYFFAHQEKYVLTREAQMWETNGFDHVFVLETPVITDRLLQAVDRMISSHAEPELVRGGARYPVKNHMYSDITIVLLSREPVPATIQKAIRQYRFARSYLFTLRGWCDGRIVAVDLAENSVYGNGQAKPLLPLYHNLLTQ